MQPLTWTLMFNFLKWWQTKRRLQTPLNSFIGLNTSWYTRGSLSWYFGLSDNEMWLIRCEFAPQKIWAMNVKYLTALFWYWQIISLYLTCILRWNLLSCSSKLDKMNVKNQLHSVFDPSLISTDKQETQESKVKLEFLSLHPKQAPVRQSPRTSALIGTWKPRATATLPALFASSSSTETCYSLDTVPLFSFSSGQESWSSESIEQEGNQIQLSSVTHGSKSSTYL